MENVCVPFIPSARYARNVPDHFQRNLISIFDHACEYWLVRRFSVRHLSNSLSSVRLTFEQIQLVRHIRRNRIKWSESKQLIKWSCLEHGQAQDL